MNTLLLIYITVGAATSIRFMFLTIFSGKLHGYKNPLIAIILFIFQAILHILIWPIYWLIDLIGFIKYKSFTGRFE